MQRSSARMQTSIENGSYGQQTLPRLCPKPPAPQTQPHLYRITTYIYPFLPTPQEAKIACISVHEDRSIDRLDATRRWRSDNGIDNYIGRLEERSNGWCW